MDLLCRDPHHTHEGPNYKLAHLLLGTFTFFVDPLCLAAGVEPLPQHILKPMQFSSLSPHPSTCSDAHASVSALAQQCDQICYFILR